MMRRDLAGALALLALGAVGTIVSLSARAESFWVKKEWRQWTKEDVLKMLEDSPWWQRFSMRKSQESAALPSRSGAAARGAAGVANEEVDYYFQLRSALPVRQALARQDEFDKKYDKMTEEEKKKFDAGEGALLNRQFDNTIVVHVIYKSNIQTFERAMASFWQSIPENTVPLDVFIITRRGDHVGPIRFISPKSGAYEFDFIFPRMSNGEPTIRDGDKTFLINFPNPRMGDLPWQRGVVEFHTDKMMFKGRLTY